MKSLIMDIIRRIVEAADDLWWDYQFRKSPQVLEMLSREAKEEYDAGLTDDFDFDSPD